MLPILIFLLSALTALAQPPDPNGPPTFTLRNAASLGTAIAPGSLITVSGYGPRQFTFPTQGLTLELTTADGAKTPLGVVKPPSISGPELGNTFWAILPKNAALGSARLLLRAGMDDPGATIPFDIVANAPAVFTKSEEGFGPAKAMNYIDNFPSLNALTGAAIPNRPVALFATGLNGAKTADVTVELAGQPVPAIYAGPQVIPGLDQVNFVVPPDAYLGCYVPVQIRVRGVLSNQVTLSINTDPYACAHPLGLSYLDLKTLDAGGNIPFASLGVYGLNAPGIRSSESAQFLFTYDNAAAMFLNARAQMPDSQYLSCSVFGPGEGGGARPGFLFAPAGDAVTFTGPGGKQLVLPSPYLGTPIPGPAPFFTAGAWQVSAPGGTEVSAFSQSFVLPPALASLNIAPGSKIAQDRDLQVTWNPAGFLAGDILTFTITGSTGGALCRTHAWAGQLTVPQAMLPASGTSLNVSVSPHPAGRTQFSIPRKDGTSMHALVNYGFSLTFPVKVE